MAFLWNIGPNDLLCEVDYEIHPGEPRVLYDSNNTGYPGSPPWVEVLNAVAIEGGKKRRLSDEEYEWLESSEPEIEEAIRTGD